MLHAGETVVDTFVLSDTSGTAVLVVAALASHCLMLHSLLFGTEDDATATQLLIQKGPDITLVTEGRVTMTQVDSLRGLSFPVNTRITLTVSAVSTKKVWLWARYSVVRE